MAAALAFGLASTWCQAAPQSKENRTMNETSESAVLPARQQAMVPVAALAASGDVDRLGPALEQGLDDGLSINEAKEILLQVYAYAGFPRSLNALGELKKVVEARQARGVKDEEGRAPGKPAPKGEALLAAGTANQTRLSGAPVTGALFDFAPAIGEYLKTHLFGDIFERDNLDWQSREIATVSMLASMRGVESQLLSHIRIAMNTGLSAGQLHVLAQVLDERVDADAGRRVRAAVAKAGASPRS
jgi:4-carboxymuconolactone decarboxylase